MINELTILHDNTHSLEKKVEFLSHATSYPDTTRVEALETHMSWVFLTDLYAYKLKKPVHYEFLDFTTPEARHHFCQEELRINKPLAGDTYVGIVTLRADDGMLNLNGAGEPVDWLVKMKRLPEEHMLHIAIRDGKVRNAWVQHAAEMLVDFYMTSPPVKKDPAQYRQQLVKDIERTGEELLQEEFNLSHSVIIGITTDLLHYVIKYAPLFDQRMAEGRIIECHGDLRPEHICLAPRPVIIDRVEFSRDLRIMDVAEELSSLALECDILHAPTTGQLFLNTYYWKSRDKITDTLMSFYKAKRAFLRAKLSIHHLLEAKYRLDAHKWESRCEAYLVAAGKYGDELPKKC